MAPDGHFLTSGVASIQIVYRIKWMPVSVSHYTAR